jgi:hypothetical protein
MAGLRIDPAELHAEVLVAVARPAPAPPLLHALPDSGEQHDNTPADEDPPADQARAPKVQAQPKGGTSPFCTRRPALPNSERWVSAYLCANLYTASDVGDRQIGREFKSSALPTRRGSCSSYGPSRKRRSVGSARTRLCRHPVGACQGARLPPSCPLVRRRRALSDRLIGTSRQVLMNGPTAVRWVRDGRRAVRTRGVDLFWRSPSRVRIAQSRVPRWARRGGPGSVPGSGGRRVLSLRQVCPAWLTPRSPRSW